ncbi:MAG: hypothetical protein R2844_16965 [Caldilineales bacterium]
MRIAEQSLKQKLLAVSDSPTADNTAVLMLRFRTEAEIFRGVAIESKLDVLGNQYNRSPTLTVSGRAKRSRFPKPGACWSLTAPHGKPSGGK